MQLGYDRLKSAMGRLERSIRWLASVAFALTTLSLASHTAPSSAQPAGASHPPLAIGDTNTLPVAAPISGTLRVLVVPAFWSDDMGPEPVTLGRIAELINAVRAYYLEASYGKLDMVPTLTPWIRLSVPRPPSGCPNVAAVKAALTSPAIASYREAGFDRIVVVQRRIAEQCFWHGIANGPSTWINGVFDEKVIAHELGHTLGLWHAHQLNCGTEAPPLVLRACRVVITGDFYAVMGKWNLGHLMAMHKAQLGWITPAVHEHGVEEYDLTPISEKGGALYAVKVVRGARTFWIERREGTGMDAKVVDASKGMAGISIRVVDGSIGCSESCVLNMGASGDDFLSNAALKVGQKWSDSGMTIEVLSPGRIKITTP
jgi:hypothetical protein